MKSILLIAILAGVAHADPPFYLRGTATNQSLGGINQNLLDQTTIKNDRLTTTITPPKCSSGQVLTGAFFNNGYTFGGSCSNVATTDGNNTFTGNNSFTGINTFSGVVNFSSNNTHSGTESLCSTVTFKSVVEYGDSSAALISRNAVEIVWAKSFDGVSESSGCLGVLAMGNTTTPLNTEPGTLVWTSTTTGNATKALAVLWDNTCAPGAVCRFATRGPVRVQARGGGTPAFGNGLITYTTRCQADAGATLTSASGQALSTESGGWIWAWMNTF